MYVPSLVKSKPYACEWQGWTQHAIYAGLLFNQDKSSEEVGHTGYIVMLQSCFLIEFSKIIVQVLFVIPTKPIPAQNNGLYILIKKFSKVSIL